MLGLVLLFDIGTAFVVQTGTEVAPRNFWIIACTFILFYAMFNAIISLLSDNMDRYWTRSMIAYVAVAGISGLLAWGFSSLSIDEAGSFRWLYIVLTFGYLMFLTMIGMMRKIVDFAQREEWNQPRLRSRKKKR